VTGKRKSSVDLPSTAAFLALDYNDQVNGIMFMNLGDVQIILKYYLFDFKIAGCEPGFLLSLE